MHRNGEAFFICPVTVYSLITILTMVALVLLGKKGLSAIQTNALERHTHSLAGATILMCGVAMVFMGW